MNETGNPQKAVKMAVEYCQKYGILKEFLEIHRMEVVDMILEEWNLEDAIAFARKETREETQKEDHKYFLELLDKGLSNEEIKQRLTITSNSIERMKL